MRPPIFVIEGHDVHLFENVDAAAGWMEVIDVRNGEFEGAFDADGRRLSILADTDRGPVRVAEPPVPEDGSEPLRAALERYLRWLHLNRPGTVTASLDGIDAWDLGQLVQLRIQVDRDWEARRQAVWWRRLRSRLRSRGS